MTTSASQFGSSKSVTTEPLITKVTSSSKTLSDSQAVAKLLADVPTWNPAEEVKLKQLLTARKQALASLGLGSTDNHLSLVDSVLSSPDFGTGQPSEPVRSKTPKRTRAIDLRAETSQAGSKFVPGAKSAASTSSVTRDVANQRSCTTPSGTKTFTLSQASRLSGSIGMQGNGFSSLMSLKELLSAKFSYGSWMAILSMAQSKAVSQALNGLLSSSQPTTTTSLASIPLSSDDSSEEDVSVSQDEEVIMGDSLSCSEELSASEDEYRYSKRARQEARRAWMPPSPTTSQTEDEWTATLQDSEEECLQED